MTQKVILLADDQPDNLAIFSAILTHHGYGVVLAANGREAVDLARDHAPKLILMDLQMPVMDGWEASRLLKSTPATADIPIVAITAEDHNSLTRLRDAGFCAYLRKPVTPDAVVDAVRQCLEEHAAGVRWIELPAYTPDKVAPPVPRPPPPPPPRQP